MRMRVRHSSGNVFRDAGFGGEEAENLRLRADLMIQLTRLIDARRLTQARAARLLGVTQPRVSDLVRGRIERFSIDSLVEMRGAPAFASRLSSGPEDGSRRNPAESRSRKGADIPKTTPGSSTTI